MNVFLGIMLPFIGTTAGASCVLFLKRDINVTIQKILLGFASGVMVAASVWSLLIPAINMSENMGKLSFIPAAVGFLIGIVFLIVMDKTVPQLHEKYMVSDHLKSGWKKTFMLVAAVTIHNIPEGMAVGVVFAGLMAENSGITLAGALALSIGIAIQNFPEGAIVSIPLKNNSMGKGKSFLLGTLSGIVEPIGAVITILLSSYIVPVLPYLLSFAAGAMIYVVVKELLPESVEGEHDYTGSIGFALGFTVMMILDVMLG